MQGFEWQIGFLRESLLQWVGVEIKNKDGAVTGRALCQCTSLLLLVS